jgi:hypothetical protein
MAFHQHGACTRAYAFQVFWRLSIIFALWGENNRQKDKLPYHPITLSPRQVHNAEVEG